jgi:citrate synthase
MLIGGSPAILGRMARMLESDEAARRLGVKLTTLYAYVSRGLLTSHPSADSRRRLFDLDEVEALAKRSRSAKRVETRIASVTTGVTQLRDDGPAYRGAPASTLAGTKSYEEVCDLLWRADPAPAQWTAVALPDPPVIEPYDVLHWAVLMCGATDPLRSDLRKEAVVRNARKIVSTAAVSLEARSSPSVSDGPGASVASRLARSFTVDSSSISPAVPRPELERAIDAALVLLADHELAPSTMAVRIAASTRADIYDALLVGLSTVAGPLHGGASEQAHTLLVQAAASGAGPAIDSFLRWQRLIPGFGHVVYLSGDPRFDALMPHVYGLATADQRAVLDSVLDIVKSHSISGPNIDLALAALTWIAGLRPLTGRMIFSVARLAGWTAHYLEELDERPLRFRARAVYSSTS